MAKDMSLYAELARWTLPRYSCVPGVRQLTWSSTKQKSCGDRFILSVIDHVIRFVDLNAIKDKEATIITRHLIERVFFVLGPPETLHSDKGTEFETLFVLKLQTMFKKTRISAYWFQGNSVLERVHNTVQNMFTMFCQEAHNLVYYDCFCYRYYFYFKI